ncbi:MAG: DEAD/DEAH box helicase [Rubripirellula sp.]|nr:DEAD/DEAH box helicase [Rubripirellula sp.]
MNFTRPIRERPTPNLLRDQLDEASGKHLGFHIRKGQWNASQLLLNRCVIEMPTGEGKTVTTLLAAASLAASGHKVLVATANDYLASRDAEWMSPLYQWVGLSVSSVSTTTPQTERATIYSGDVVYGTLREFAFDFLRQSLANRQRLHTNKEQTSQFDFPLDVLIMDEADSILIDEARTPMIITAPIVDINNARESCYRWASEAATEFHRPSDYVRLGGDGVVALTASGRKRVLRETMPSTMAALTTTDILHALERAILINETIHRDVHYVVHEDNIQLVDEYTGRKAAERNFGGGVHQAIEAREGLALSRESAAIARISVQDFVALFTHLGGMTATAWEDRNELRQVYDLKVHRVRAHRKSKRVLMPPTICRSLEQKWSRIAEETQSMVAANRSVLIGTRTIAQSEELSELLAEKKITHVVLNARNPASEAAIVAQAGQPGRVTVATNMAGRGTDIRLSERVANAGGMHVIVSEVHAASRIDRQLIGRSSRQGDPGSARLFVSPEDEIIIQAFGEQEAAKIRSAAQQGSTKWLLAKVLSAQKRVTQLHRNERAEITARDLNLADAMHDLGLDPHLDPLQESN